jgi:hypothetical protein
VTLYDRTNPTIKGKPKNLLPTISVRNVRQLLYDLPYLQKKIMIKVDPAYLFNFQHAVWIFKGQDGPLRKDLKKGAKTLKKGRMLSIKSKHQIFLASFAWLYIFPEEVLPGQRTETTYCNCFLICCFLVLNH